MATTKQSSRKRTIRVGKRPAGRPSPLEDGALKARHEETRTARSCRAAAVHVHPYVELLSSLQLGELG